jgi:hypothetical protein
MDQTHTRIVGKGLWQQEYLNPTDIGYNFIRPAFATEALRAR